MSVEIKETSATLRTLEVTIPQEDLKALEEALDDALSNAEEIRDGDIEFPYLLLKGKATTRNAIKLLEIIGYDEEIISRAEKLAEKFIAERTWK